MLTGRAGLSVMLSPRRTQRGVTLVELMIASVIALVALAALLTAYSATAMHSANYLHKAHLHQQLHSLMHAMVQDIRRSGYWSFDPGLRSAAENPFQAGVNRLRMQAYPGESPGSCMLFAYDLDKDGMVGVGRCNGNTCAAQTDSDNVEQFGFRLHDGLVQTRYGGDTLRCDSGHWQAVTDPGIAVTLLSFTLHETCTNLDNASADCESHAARILQRLVEIRLSGFQRARPDTSLTLSASVRVRNDQVLGAAE
jgi:prepilin-type N-terminal cleavage/methylation domain-containing protein